MTDDRVDELLKDLDDALSIEPSPVVAARVRTRIAEKKTGGWRLLAQSAVVASAVFVAVLSYMTWSRGVTAPQPQAVVGRVEPQPASAAGTVRPETGTASGTAEPAHRRGSAAHSPQRRSVVQVSSATRLAFEQLQSAVASGRLMAPLPGDHMEIEPTVITPLSIELEPLTIEMVTVGSPAVDPDSPIPSSSLSDDQRSLS